MSLMPKSLLTTTATKFGYADIDKDLKNILLSDDNKKILMVKVNKIKDLT